MTVHFYSLYPLHVFISSKKCKSALWLVTATVHVSACQCLSSEPARARYLEFRKFFLFLVHTQLQPKILF